MYCSAGTPNCGANGFLSGYNAGSGYNLATGLGSVDVTNLVDDWANDSLASTTTSLSLDKTSFTHGTIVNISAGVTPSAATGNVAIENNYGSQSQATTTATPTRLSLSGGSASESYSQFPGGTYNVYANYGGDGTYAGSVSQPVQVKVSPENSVLQFSADTINSSFQLASVAGATVPLGSFITLNAQPVGSSQVGNPNPVTNATGTVQFTDSATGGLAAGTGNATLDSTGNAEANTLYLPAGTHSITASYSGDLSYNPSSSGTISLTVSMAPTTITLTSSASSVFNGGVYLNAQMMTSVPLISLAAYGSVTFTDTTSNTVLGTTNSGNFGQCTGATTLCIGAPLQVHSTQLQMGANSIVATYTGDSNFIGSGPSAPATVTCTASCWNAAGQTIGLSFRPAIRRHYFPRRDDYSCRLRFTRGWIHRPGQPHLLGCWKKRRRSECSYMQL